MLQSSKMCLSLFQVESANKMKDDAIKQARKIQSQLKDYQRELDEAKAGKDDLIAAAKEAEKKLKANEAEMAQVHFFFFISTPFFSPSLDVLIFGAFSASNVLKRVLNHILYVVQITAKQLISFTENNLNC